MPEGRGRYLVCVVHDGEVRPISTREGVIVRRVRLNQKTERQGSGATREQNHERDDEALEFTPAKIGHGGGDDGVHRATPSTGVVASTHPSTSDTTRWAQRSASRASCVTNTMV